MVFTPARCINYKQRIPRETITAFCQVDVMTQKNRYMKIPLTIAQLSHPQDLGTKGILQLEISFLPEGLELSCLHSILLSPFSKSHEAIRAADGDWVGWGRHGQSKK